MRISGMIPVLGVADIERTIAFYQDVLGFEIVERIPPKRKLFRARMRLAGAELAFAQLSPKELSRCADRTATPGVVFTFATEDVLELYDALKEKGHDIGSPRLTPVGTMACRLSDPDGYELSFEQPIGELAMTKARLLDLIRAERARFEEIIAPLSDSQMTEPNVQGKWSVKDILAHVSAWEEHVLEMLEADARGETPALITWAEVDRINEQFYQQNRDRSLEDVRTGFNRSLQRMLDMVEARSEEELLSPERFAWLRGTPLWLMVASDTFDHYTEHGARIRAWLGRPGA